MPIPRKSRLASGKRTEPHPLSPSPVSTRTPDRERGDGSLLSLPDLNRFTGGYLIVVGFLIMGRAGAPSPAQRGRAGEGAPSAKDPAVKRRQSGGVLDLSIHEIEAP